MTSDTTRNDVARYTLRAKLLARRVSLHSDSLLLGLSLRHFLHETVRSFFAHADCTIPAYVAFLTYVTIART